MVRRLEMKGVLPVFQTPFQDDDSIDYRVLAGEIEWMHQHGIDGIVMAMVSELLRLSTEERRHLAERACKHGLPHGFVVISVGAESTRVATELARHAETVGASAVMAIPPIATPLATEQIIGYYEAILDAVEIPVVVQDASGYVGQPMSIEAQAALLTENPNRVLFKPEAAPIGPRLTALMDATGGEALMFGGSAGGALVDSHRRGAIGCMPGADVCWAIVALWRALKAKDHPRIEAIEQPLSELVALQPTLDAYLAVEKYLLHRQGVFPNIRVRGPVSFQLDAEAVVEVDRLFERLRQAVYG